MSILPSSQSSTAVRIASILPVLVLASMVGPLALNIIMPSLPGFPATFHTTKETAQLTLSLFLAGMALSQILLGPLADRFGRKPVLVSAMALFVAMTSLAIFATSINVLIVARFFQAFGAAAGLSISRAMLRDLFPRERAASMIGYVTMGMGVAPMIAPALGGFLDEQFGWQAIFQACLLLGIVALVACFVVLPETRPQSLQSAGFADVFRRSVGLLKKPAFLGYALSSAFAGAMFFSFVGAAPYLVVETLKLPKDVYGLWFVIIAVGYMVGNFLSGRFSQRVGISRMIAAGNALGVICGVLITVLSLIGIFTPAALFVPAFIMSIGNGLVLPSAISAAVSVDVQAAGAASGLTGFLQAGIGGIATYLAGAIVSGSALPVALLMLMFSALAIAAMRLTRA